jgi:hypothetical protein
MEYYLRRYSDDDGRVIQVNLYVDEEIAKRSGERRVIAPHLSVLLASDTHAKEFFLIGGLFTGVDDARRFLEKILPADVTAREYVPAVGTEVASLTGGTITGVTWVGSKDAR